MSKITYMYRVNNGLCVRCGSALPPEYRDRECKACKDSRKLYRKDEATKTYIAEERKARGASTFEKWNKEAIERGLSYGELKKLKTLEKIERGKT